MALMEKIAEKTLQDVDITVNKNGVPYDTRKPFDPSGIRFGTPALTTRGMKESEMKRVGELFALILKSPNDERVRTQVRAGVHELCQQFPLYPEL